MHSDVALLDAPARRPATPTGAGVAASPSAALRLTVAGAAWTVPMETVRGIAEAGPLTAMPLTSSPVEGLTAIEGRPVLQIDTARALDRASNDHPLGAGRVVVVVATAAGELALRVDDARWADGNAAPALDLAQRLPWTGGTVTAVAASQPKRNTAATLPLLRIRQGTEEVALRVDRLERVGRADWAKPLPDSADTLVSLDGLLLPARALSPHPADTAPHALLLRGDAAGERAVLLVERALGVERCPLDRLVAVAHPSGGGSVWWRPADGAPLRVVDPGPLFGWSAHAVENTVQDPLMGRNGAARPQTLVVEVGGFAVALPLALVAQVEEPAAGAAGCRVRLAGVRSPRRAVLHVDRISPLEADREPDGEAGTAGWQSLKALPPAAALLFDAARWNARAGRWVFRVKVDALTQPVAKRVAWAPRRTLLAAWRGWASGKTP